MDACDSANQPKLKPSVILSGTAKEGSAGPPIGLVDIGISENAYLFRVALPGIRRNESNLKCDIQHNGTVHIKGVVTVDAGMLKDSSSVFQMRVQQLCPPGPFTISFKLPGPVDPRLFCPNFRNDGVLEVAVMKYRPPSAPTNGVLPLRCSSNPYASSNVVVYNFIAGFELFHQTLFMMDDAHNRVMYWQRYESSRKWDCASPQLAANDEEQRNQIQEPVEPESPSLLEKFNLNKAMRAMDER